MGTKGKNFIESVARIIPGYRGYSEREARRDSDRMIRSLLARNLDSAVSDIERAIGDCARRSDFVHLEDLESLRRRAGTEADRLRSAVSGYSGFFDTVQVELEDLERLHEFDARLREEIDAVVSAAEALAGAPDGEHVNAVNQAMRSLERTLGQRDKVMKGVN